MSNMSQLYWGVVRASITDAGREYEGPLNEWWSYEHMPDFVALEGFRRGWRLRTIEHESAIGDPDQLYSAAYEIESVDAFSAALEAFHPPWGPWQEHIDDWLIDWSRTYYRLLGTFDEQSDDGGYWAIVRASLSLDGPDQEQELNDWYTNTHMPEICDNPGVHRAWRLEREEHDDVEAPSPYRYWGVYQVESPEAFAAARARRTERGVQPWDGIWLPQLEEWTISYHEIMHRVTHESAVGGGGRAPEERLVV